MPNAAQTMRELRAKQMREHAKRVAENRREIETREALERAETEPPKESA